ncbi:MAG: hypothetical protein P8O10_01520 [Pseudorhodobacter sp.]|nr:hypothetical protein [Pseudorhodobacter sp.]
MTDTTPTVAERMVNIALDIATHILEQHAMAAENFKNPLQRSKPNITQFTFS